MVVFFNLYKVVQKIHLYSQLSINATILLIVYCLIILWERVAALRTLIEDRAALIHRPKLHRIEIQTRVVAFRTRLFYSSMLIRNFDHFIVFLDPLGFGRGRGAGEDLARHHPLRAACKGAAGAAHSISLWSWQNASTHRTERPRARHDRLYLSGYKIEKLYGPGDGVLSYCGAHLGKENFRDFLGIFFRGKC